nr:LacI family DNA-binding transcriptional regulator [Georgenia sp. SYP-B2076]
MVDVAKLAGVSPQTVSRVVNGSPHVSDESRDRVERAISHLDYRRNTAARALATRRTMNIGVVSVGTSQFGPAQTLFGIAEEARKLGYGTSLVSLGQIDRESMRAAIEHLAADAVDGVIVLAPIAAAATAVAGISSSLPLVMFEPGAEDGPVTVAQDEELGARLATRHLLELGHRSVHHLAGPDGWLGSEARTRGWARELSMSARVAHPVRTGDWSAESGYTIGLELLRQPDVTAVYVANDQMALGCLKAAHELGIEVPEQLSIVGFDDIPEARFYVPALTTVRLDFAQVGRRCVSRLLHLIGVDGDELRPVDPPTLVVRASTAPPPAAG